ncbi:MAG TPA: ABC transporter substrate-binding protein [Iamia sp.]|nr:ABC transporter substrate-binding protein [Iamia sp.]
MAAVRTDTRFCLFHHPVAADGWPRRRFLAGGLAAGAVIALGACSGRSDDDGAGAGTTEGSGRRTVVSPSGTVEVPERVERVVAFGEAINTLLDLGLTPVGAPEGSETWVAAEHVAAMGEVPKVGPQEAPIAERILEARPDVVMVVSYMDPLPDLGIPVVVVDDPARDDWKAMAEVVADAAGRRGDLDGLRRRYEERQTEVAETHAAVLAGATWALMMVQVDSWWALGTEESPFTELAPLGIVPSGIMEPIGRAVSFERSDLMADADVIAFFDTESALVGTLEDSAYAAVAGEEVFTSLPAARAGRVVASSALRPYSYGRALEMLDAVEAIVARLG